MDSHVDPAPGCLLVGEYVDEAEVPGDRPVGRSEVVRPQVVATFCDVWSRDEGLREFTVLFKDGRVVVVRGHRLKCDLPRLSVFSVVVRSGEEEVIVALFKSDDVSGIFHGELRVDRKTA